MNEQKAAEAIEKALEHQENGELAEAAATFLQAAEHAPADHRLPDEAGNLYLYALNQPLDAIPCYERALAIVPDPPRVALKLGLAHSLAGHDEPALQQFEAAGRAEPTNPMVPLELGKHHLLQGRHQDAVEYFDTAVAHYTMSSTFGTAMGGPAPSPQILALALMGKARVCLLHLDREADGLGAVRTLLEQLDDTARGVKLAGELRDAGKRLLATQVIDAVLAHDPDDDDARSLQENL